MNPYRSPAVQREIERLAQKRLERIAPLFAALEAHPKCTPTFAAAARRNWLGDTGVLSEGQFTKIANLVDAMIEILDNPDVSIEGEEIIYCGSLSNRFPTQHNDRGLLNPTLGGVAP